ncbi:MAG: hypothetical protein J6U62_02980 [Bacteroidaceae bacterium]|nr:hypothetical protein [Bacteroidaceae bacterium]
MLTDGVFAWMDGDAWEGMAWGIVVVMMMCCNDNNREGALGCSLSLLL